MEIGDITPQEDLSNIRSSKKLAKAMRKEARKHASEFQDNLVSRLNEINISLRPRPKWIPLKVWRWFGNKFVDMTSVENFLKK